MHDWQTYLLNPLEMNNFSNLGMSEALAPVLINDLYFVKPHVMYISFKILLLIGVTERYSLLFQVGMSLCNSMSKEDK